MVSMTTSNNSEARIAQLERKVEVLERLAEISTILNSRVQLEPLLNHIMAVAVEITGCEAASVLLWNSRTRELFFAASTTMSQENKLIGMPVPMDSIAGTILQKNQIIQVDDAANDPRHYSKVGEEISFETRSLLGVPMTYKDRVIGVLEALNKDRGPWTVDDRNYLSILAAQAAVAIEGAQLVMDLRRAYEELAEVDKLKNDFIAIASHELRTPLGVIMGYASFLQEEESQSTQAHASKVLESALKLRKIIEDMVNLRYLKQNQNDLNIEDVTVEEMLRSLQRDMVTLVDSGLRDIQFKTTDADCTLRVDHTRMLMALTNLLNNAVSFTNDNDEITIEATVKGDEVYFVIADNGTGFDPAFSERIFEEFYQIEDHMTRRHGGLGIGLSISRAIVRAHGGRIWAESEGHGTGARFTVALPCG